MSYEYISEDELNFLCKLLTARQPTKLVAVDAWESTVSTIRNCIQRLDLSCQISTLERKEILSLPAFLSEVGCKIDFLILNSSMPEELLDFISIFPYLSENATVVIQDIVNADSKTGIKFASSNLYQNIVATKYQHNQEYYPSIAERVRLLNSKGNYLQEDTGREVDTQPHCIMSAFQLNTDVSQYIADLFAALWIPWPHTLESSSQSVYTAMIAKHYDSKYLQSYQQALETANHFLNPYLDILDCLQNSLFQTYHQILIYGKGARGQEFFKIATRYDIHIAGFVISDGRLSEEQILNTPIYQFSQIPFDAESTLIILATPSVSVENKIRQSRLHYLKLPEKFWESIGGVK